MAEMVVDAPCCLAQPAAGTTLPWPQQGRMVEVKRASLIPIKGMMGIPYPAVKRGFSAVNMPLASC